MLFSISLLASIALGGEPEWTSEPLVTENLTLGREQEVRMGGTAGNLFVMFFEGRKGAACWGGVFDAKQSAYFATTLSRYLRAVAQKAQADPPQSWSPTFSAEQTEGYGDRTMWCSFRAMTGLQPGSPTQHVSLSVKSNKTCMGVTTGPCITTEVDLHLELSEAYLLATFLEKYAKKAGEGADP